MIPLLTIATILYACFVYSNVYSTILSGFDRKLFVASSTSGSFIDGDKHNQIFEPKLIKGLAFVDYEDGKVLVGLDSSNGSFVSLSLEAGEASEITKLALDQTDLSSTNDITYLPKEHKLLAVVADRNILVEIDQSSGAIIKKVALVYGDTQKLTGIEFVEKTGATYLSNSNLYKLDRKNGKLEFIAKLSDQIISALSWDKESDRLIGVESITGRLLSIDYNSGQSVELGVIEPSKEEVKDSESKVEESEAWIEPEIITLPVYGVVKSSDNIFASTDRLIKWSPENSSASAAHFRKGFRNDNSALYLKFVEPMRKILKSLDLTYHYTVLLLQGNTMAYVLDATEGDEHSPAGTEEENTEQETNRLNDVMHSGRVSLSDIQEFEKWGLLKIGTAPIFNSKGEVKALVGADVNISVINSKTREALLEVLAVGVLALLMAVLASLLIAKKLLAPINLLKEAALKVAAGNFDHGLNVVQPKELKELSESFQTASTLLLESGAELQKSNAEFETIRRQQELEKLLKNGSNASLLSPLEILNTDKIEISVNSLNVQDESTSGSIGNEDFSVIWVIKESSDSLENARRHSDVRTISLKLINTSCLDVDVLSRELPDFLSEKVELLMLVDKAQGSIKILSHQNKLLGHIWSNKQSKKLSLGEASMLTVQNGDSLFISLDSNYISCQEQL
jgi:HAMP domain-containing protein